MRYKRKICYWVHIDHYWYCPKLRKWVHENDLDFEKYSYASSYTFRTCKVFRTNWPDGTTISKSILKKGKRIWIDYTKKFKDKNMSRKFDRIIFFGNSNCIEKMQLLRFRLEEAFSIMSGMQQPPHSCTEEEAKINEDIYTNAVNDLNDIILDIRTALGDFSLIQKNIFSKSINILKNFL